MESWQRISISIFIFGAAIGTQAPPDNLVSDSIRDVCIFLFKGSCF